MALLLIVSCLFGVGWAQEVRGSVWLIPIDTEITPATAQYVRSRIELANRERPLALVFLLDTPGGQVSAMQRIVDAILGEAQVPTIAVVENAFSAGALIAMSAEQLAMLPGSSIGAALPITLTPTGARPVSEKFNSAVRGQFRSVAEARGRNARIAEAMVDQRIEIPGLSTSEELVTLTAAQAVEFDIADIQARTLSDALEQLGYGGVRVERLEPNLSERLGTALANPVVAAALLVIGIGGIIIEIFTPGFGIPGGLGVLALALLAVSAFVATPASVIDILLILGGVLLLAAEILLIPGFGVAGILGIGAVIAAVLRIFQDNAVFVLAYAALFASILMAFIIFMLPRFGLGRVLTLTARISNESADPAAGGSVAGREDLLGRSGVALSDLRPAGIVRLGEERVDVVTEGNFISAGTEIKVVRVEGSRVTVRSKSGQGTNE